MPLTAPLASLGDLSLATFMQDFWQKKPALIRGVLPADFCPVSLDLMTELACSDEADSRLIISEEWPPEIYHGPFEPEELEDVPETDWTLLVQEMDRLVPGAARLLDCFRFIPNWRVDDLMVSYAAPGGGVGAHTDQYDVFLIQGLGRRRWEIDPRPNLDPQWREGSDVAVLADFEAVESWEVEPGDVVYLPPHVAHNGIALTECMTLSVGFRAPAAHELLESLLGYANEGQTKRFAGGPTGAVRHPGAVDQDTLRGLRQDVRALLADDRQLNAWLGRALTEPVRGRMGREDAVQPELPARGRIRPVSAAQTAHIEEEDAILLCVSGQVFELPHADLESVRRLTGVEGLEVSEGYSASLKQAVCQLLEEGLLALD